ncbi:MAG: UDP-3-O-acyl-N-acetylglucosamine deacetylase [Chromatiales bacterium]
MNHHIQYQKTLREPISFVGIGLHSGKRAKITLKPSMDSSGIYFLRKDVEAGTGLIPARWYNVQATTMSTTLMNKQGTTVDTVEHLMAALFGCGVDNALVEVDGPEVPIMDGSAAPFATTIERIGTRKQSAPRHAIWVQRPIEVREGDKFAILMPHPTPRITIAIDFPGTAVGAQTFSVELVNEAFRNDIARARTFGFAQQLNGLRSRGLALGGSLNNAILVDGERIVNEGGLRYDNEFVRHKVLDAFGDLALAGVPIFGYYYAYKPGHSLNHALMKQLFSDRSAWSYIAVDEFQQLFGEPIHAEQESEEVFLKQENIRQVL